MTHLPNDICRCHNDRCQKRESCRRFVERSRVNQEEFDIITHSEDCSAGVVPCPKYMKLA